MRVSEVEYTGAVPVDGYGPGFFRVGGEVVEGPVLLTATGRKPWAGLEDIEPLRALVGDVDVLFIGTGDALRPIDPALQSGLEQAGMGVELMASPTAARTFNVLLGEGRRVAVAMMPVGAVGS